MFAWIAENAVTLAAAALVLLLIGIAVISLVNDKKNHKGGCTGNCAACGMGCSGRGGKI
ncbi:MAG: FeoB-associated Cys-rich membrane protein [Clostridia bacterium]|nr:FeoB-associated Cys-rich membrane protein [Clostridia bacterium]